MDWCHAAHGETPENHGDGCCYPAKINMTTEEQQYKVVSHFENDDVPLSF